MFIYVFVCCLALVVIPSCQVLRIPSLFVNRFDQARRYPQGLELCKEFCHLVVALTRIAGEIEACLPAIALPIATVSLLARYQFE